MVDEGGGARTQSLGITAYMAPTWEGNVAGIKEAFSKPSEALWWIL